MYSIHNQAIMASAGTGKTFSVAMRFIALLHMGVKPAEIVAITFTNKAAGEIFDKIVQELLGMIRSPEKLAQLVEKEILPPMEISDLVKILRGLLCCRERLQISTIDSFFLNIVQAFPLECGIYGDITVIDDKDDRPRQKALLGLLRELTEEERAALREAVKENSRGDEVRSLYSVMKRLIDLLYGVYLSYPDAQLWGNGVAIWPSFDPRQLLSDEELAKLHAVCVPLLAERAGIGNKTLIANFTALADHALHSRQEPRLPADAEKALKPLFDADPAWLDTPDDIHFKYRTDYTVSGEAAKCLRALVRHLRALEFVRLMKRSKAAFRLMERFDRTYAAEVRSAGKLTFRDTPYLLRPTDPESGQALPFSDRENIEERLDAVTNHYMLDEFQDTSDHQWQALANLADEVIVGDGDRFRSFFYVGDIKQSIYQWRNGNPKLFEAIRSHYSPENYGERGIQKGSLSLSFRSSLPVIDAVNGVFGSPGRCGCEAAEQAIQSMHFVAHDSAGAAREQAGFSALLEMEIVAKDEYLNKAKVIYRLLRQIRPFERRPAFSVGILVRKNAAAIQIAELLRKFAAADGTALPISIDGKVQVGQSMAFVIYSQLLRYAAHPGDKLARNWLEMCVFNKRKLGRSGLAERLGYRGSLSGAVRKELETGGFPAFTDRFLAAFAGELSDFDRRRMESVRESSLGFEGSVDEFLNTLSWKENTESSLRKTVQIMTVHKSKGLDFDVVFLPDLGGRNGISTLNAITDPVAGLDDQFKPLWVSYLPNRYYVEAIPGFRAWRAEKIRNITYENCCNLYVGMTRARHALYMLIDEKGGGATVRAEDLVRNTLLGREGALVQEAAPWVNSLQEGLEFQITLGYCNGNREWFTVPRQEKHAEGIAARAEEKRRERMAQYAPDSVVVADQRLYHKRLASSEHESRIAPEKRFEEGEAALLGTRIHELFSLVVFSDDFDLEHFIEAHFSVGDRNGEVEILFRHAWESVAIRAALRRPVAARVELWCEKRFLLADPDSGELIPGAFDRVVISRSETGEIQTVEILDYKSDRLNTPGEFLERHSGQLALYRVTLAKMLHIDPQKIRCALIALRPGLVIDC